MGSSTRRFVSRLLRAPVVATCTGALHLLACDLNALIPEEARTFVIPAETEVEIPGVSIVSNPLLPADVLPADLGPALSAQLAQSFSTEGVDKDAIASATLSAMRVEVLEPDENGRRVRDLGFLRSLAFSLGAEGMPAELVSFSEEGAFDDDPIAYEFQLTGAELSPLIQAADALEMTGDVEVEGRPTFATTLRFEVEMTVVADVAGALN